MGDSAPRPSCIHFHHCECYPTPIYSQLQLSTIKILHFSNGLCYFITIWGILCAVTQHVSTVIVTSRFIFAQARDYGIPFSNFFMKTTKKKEPWAADLGIIITMYISVIAWFDNQSRIYNLARSFAWWFTSVGYVSTLRVRAS